MADNEKKEKMALIGEIVVSVQELNEKEVQRVLGIAQGMKISKELRENAKGA